MQPQLVAQVGARAILAGRDLAGAQAAPRWTVEDFGPGSASRPAVEPGLEPALLDELRGRGHALTELDRPQPGWGPVSIIAIDGKTVATAADPRVDTTAATVA